MKPTAFQRGARAARQQVFAALRRIEGLTKDAAEAAKRHGKDADAAELKRDLGTLALIRQVVRRQPMPVEKRGGAR